eukprot:6201171-Pleurochrysis_carterae.AAC.2
MSKAPSLSPAPSSAQALFTHLVHVFRPCGDSRTLYRAKCCASLAVATFVRCMSSVSRTSSLVVLFSCASSRAFLQPPPRSSSPPFAPILLTRAHLSFADAPARGRGVAAPLRVCGYVPAGTSLGDEAAQPAAAAAATAVAARLGAGAAAHAALAYAKDRGHRIPGATDAWT